LNRGSERIGSTMASRPIHAITRIRRSEGGAQLDGLELRDRLLKILVPRTVEEVATVPIGVVGYRRARNHPQYDVAPGDQRFLMIKEPSVLPVVTARIDLLRFAPSLMSDV
jgi:hypothetical protein